VLTTIHPKLPMRNKSITMDFYLNKLGFNNIGIEDYDAYLILAKDSIEIHFFEFKNLDPKENYGQIYIRTDAIEKLYQSFLENKVIIHPKDPLQIKPWGQREFSIQTII
jgi:hypothetical protein